MTTGPEASSSAPPPPTTSTSSTPLALLGAAQVLAQPRGPLVDALLACLRDGFDPEADPPRTSHALGAGQLLLMPSGTDAWVGTKLVTVAPGNPARDLPLVQGSYVLFDAATLTPRCVLDGAALTTLRTPAVSLLALRLLAPAPVRRAVVLGSGVQARGHVEALLECTAVERVDVVGRDPGRRDALTAAVRDAGREGGSLAPEEVGAVRGADVVVCATSAAEPLFAADLIDGATTVLAVGSYQPRTTELEPALVGRSQVVVESRASALREAGDVLLPLAAGLLAEDELVTLSALATGAVAPDPDRPRVFKGTGMPWQDLVCAAALAGGTRTSS